MGPGKGEFCLVLCLPVGIMDDLLNDLESSGFGCHINFRFFGAIAYADDILLFSPTLSGLNRLLKICNKWSTTSKIEFNASKSQTICFGLKRRHGSQPVPQLPVSLGDQLIPTFENVTHLGHILSCYLDDSPELIRIAKSFNKQFNAFYSRFCEIRNVELKKYLFTSFCTSYYGIEIVDPKKVSVAAVKFWRKSVNLATMKLLSLPRESVSQFLIAEGILNADSSWSFRSLLFWKNLQKLGNFSSPLFDTCNEVITNLMIDFPSIGDLSAASRSKIKDAVILSWGNSQNLMGQAPCHRTES